MGTAADAVPPMLETADPPTAFFVTTDGDALAVVRAVHLSGRRVPEDGNVVGYTRMHEIGRLASVSASVRVRVRVRVPRELRRYSAGRARERG